MDSTRAEVLVIGAGPAGAIAALRAAELGARTILLSSGAYGGTASDDGPVPAGILSHAARLLRDARQLGRFGITVSEPVLDYPRLLARVRDVVEDLRSHSAVRRRLDALGVTILEHAGTARFDDSHTIVTESGLRVQGEKIILCTGGVNRRLPIRGIEFTGSPNDAWRLTSVPASMIVVGGSDTGLQVASVFHSLGSRIQVFEGSKRFLPHADDDVAAAVGVAFRESGISVHEDFGAIDSFEKTESGVRMLFTKDSKQSSAEAAIVIVAVGGSADTGRLNLAAAGVELDGRGFVKVDGTKRTSAPHIFAAGDVTDGLMLVPEAVQDGFVAASNAVQGTQMQLGEHVSPTGSFTEPEYAQVGLTETESRRTHDVVTALVPFDSTTRTIIDGHESGFCKLIVDRASSQVLGCHVVGERAVDIVQVAAIVIASHMRVNELAHIPLSFPTHAGILVNAAAIAAGELKHPVRWQADSAGANPVSTLHANSGG